MTHNDELGFGFGNAAGECKLLEDVREAADTPMTDIRVGSGTVEQRNPNPGNTFWYDTETGVSLNSRGLPNPGCEYYRRHLPKMVDMAHAAGKRLHFSVAGFSTEEYVRLTLIGLDAGVDVVEENDGCPNVWGDSGQKPIVSYSAEMVRRNLGDICEAADIRGHSIRKITKKFSPLEPGLLAAHAATVREFGIGGVVTSNTMPNAYMDDEFGRKRIDVGDGLAGLAGTPLIPIVCGQIIQCRKILLPTQQVWAAGGVRSGADIKRYLELGASGVQVGSYAFHFGNKVFGELLTEYIDLSQQPA